jgi:hypothetical protein
MATEIRFRRGTTAQHSTFTGALAEVTVDTDKKTVVVHDGITVGGIPLPTSVNLSDKANKTYVDDQDALKANKTGDTFSGNISLSGNDLLDVNLGVPDYIKGLITSKTSAYVISAAVGGIKGQGKFVSNTIDFSKNLNAAWAAGSGNGGRLDAAAVAASTTYHCQALRKDSDGTFDWGYSLLPIPATVPTGYSWIGRFDWCYTNAGASAVVDYTQLGNVKILLPFSWLNTSSSNVDALYQPPIASPVPSGIKTHIIITALATSNANGAVQVQVNHGESSVSSGGPVNVYTSAVSSAVATRGANWVTTDLSRGVRILVNVSGTGGTAEVLTSQVDDFTLNRIY